MVLNRRKRTRLETIFWSFPFEIIHGCGRRCRRDLAWRSRLLARVNAEVSSVLGGRLRIFLLCRFIILRSRQLLMLGHLAWFSGQRNGRVQLCDNQDTLPQQTHHSLSKTLHCQPLIQQPHVLERCSRRQCSKMPHASKRARGGCDLGERNQPVSDLFMFA